MQRCDWLMEEHAHAFVWMLFVYNVVIIGTDIILYINKSKGSKHYVFLYIAKKSFLMTLDLLELNGVRNLGSNTIHFISDAAQSHNILIRSKKHWNFMILASIILWRFY